MASELDEFEVKDGKLGKLKPAKSQEAQAADGIDVTEFEVSPDAIQPLPKRNGSPDPDDIPLLVALAQGASMGFSDELMARLESLIAGTDYRQNWDRKQRELEALRMAHPKTMLGGEIAGSIASMAIPGGMMAKGIASAGMLGKAARIGALGAGQGAAEGLGKSQYSLLEDQYERPEMQFLLPALDSAKGAFEGTLGAGVGVGAGKLISAGHKLVKEPVKKGVRAISEKFPKFFYGVDPDIAEDVLKNADLYKTPPKTIKQVLDEDMVPLMSKVSREASEGKKLAVSMLTKNEAMTPGDFEKAVVERFSQGDLIRYDPGLKKVVAKHGDAMQRQLEGVVRYARSLAGKKGYLTEIEANRLNDYLDAFAKHGKAADGAAKEIADAYKQVQGMVNERLYRRPDGSLSEYGEIMTRVQKQTQDLEEVRKATKLQRAKKFTDDGPRYTYGNEAIGSARQIRLKEQTADVLERFVKEYGDDTSQYITAMLRRPRNEKAMKPRALSFGTFAGLLTGQATGIPLLGVPGAIRDVAGPPIFKQIAKSTGSSAPLNLDPFTRPATVNLFTSPILDPNIVGYPFHGHSAEEVRQKRATGEWK